MFETFVWTHYQVVVEEISLNLRRMREAKPRLSLLTFLLILRSTCTSGHDPDEGQF